ncbi:uncharacterized protein LOC116433494 isoform X2 [Nomia melanderi]
MKAIAVCVACVLALTILADAEQSQNKIQQQIFDALTTDQTVKMKRPFCNAFTGCGRKRSFLEDSASQDLELTGSVRLPVSVYRALLRAAAQNMRNTMDRETNEYQLPDIPQAYLPRMPPHKRMDIPIASLE